MRLQFSLPFLIFVIKAFEKEAPTLPLFKYISTEYNLHCALFFFMYLYLNIFVHYNGLIIREALDVKSALHTFKQNPMHPHKVAMHT